MRVSKISYGLIILITACVQPFEFTSSENDSLLVIDASLTDELKVHEVHLSYTKAINDKEQNFVRGATVYVHSSAGDSYQYHETDSGYYSNEAYSARAGVNYQLVIETSNKTYRSSWEPMLSSPHIDSIYMKLIERPSEILNRNEQGMQVFINAGITNAQFFRATWSETYEIRVPYPSSLDYLGPGNWMVRQEPVGVCYESGRSRQLILGSSASNVSGRLLEFPIHFVSLETERLRYRYAIEVKLHAINREAYDFYKQLKKINEGGGSLFDSQQGSVFGNISSSTDESEMVLGYFEVAGVSSRRVFFNWDDLNLPVSRPGYRFDCSPNEIIETTPDLIDAFMNPRRRLINIGSMPPTATIAPEHCSDCTSFSSTTKPDFWE